MTKTETKQFIDTVANIKDGQHITLEKNAEYHLWQDEATKLTGCYTSNSGQIIFSPNGEKTTPFYMKNKKNVTVDGNGASLIIHGKMTPFIFDGCKNVTVKNLTVDYARPTMNEFTVLENKGGECVIKISPECPYELDGNNLIWVSEKGKNGEYFWSHPYRAHNVLSMYFDPKAEISQMLGFEEGDSFPSVPSFASVERIDDWTLRVVLNDKNAVFPEGSVIQTRCIYRDELGSFFHYCENLKFENLRVKFMHGLGFLSQYCKNVSFKYCDLTPAKNRTISSTSDFFQFSGCRGKLVVENCRAFGAHDDFVNCHGTHLQITEKNDSQNSVVVRFMNKESWGFRAFNAGDRIEFIKWNTLIPYFKAKVLSFERLNDYDIRLFLSKKLPDGIELGHDVVENATYTPSLYIRNNYFGRSVSRGVLATTRGKVLVENNVFYRNSRSALLIEDDCNFWFESGYTKNVIFRNNVVIGAAYGHADFERKPEIRFSPKVLDENTESYVHKKLTVVGNKFKDAPDGHFTIELSDLMYAKIKNNEFDAPYSITTNRVKKVRSKNNKQI